MPSFIPGLGIAELIASLGSGISLMAHSVMSTIPAIEVTFSIATSVTFAGRSLRLFSNLHISKILIKKMKFIRLHA